MQAEICWAWTVRPKCVFPGAIYGLPLTAWPLPSVPPPLGRSRLQRPCSPGRVNGHVSVASSRLRRLTSGRRTGWCSGLQSQVREDLLDHRLLQDCRNDLQLAAAVRAVLQVEVESGASAKTNLYSSYVAAKTRLSSRGRTQTVQWTVCAWRGAGPLARRGLQGWPSPAAPGGGARSSPRTGRAQLPGLPARALAVPLAAPLVGVPARAAWPKL